MFDIFYCTFLQYFHNKTFYVFDSKLERDLELSVSTNEGQSFKLVFVALVLPFRFFLTLTTLFCAFNKVVAFNLFDIKTQHSA